MEHQVELLRRSPANDFKFLVANIPQKYFEEIRQDSKKDIVKSEPTDHSAKRRKAKSKQKRQQFLSVCKVTLTYIKVSVSFS